MRAISGAAISKKKNTYPNGLGLSLSNYIVKAHGRELKVETKEARPDDPRLNDPVGQAVGRGEGSKFTIVF